MKKVIYYFALIFAVIATSCSNEHESTMVEEEVLTTKSMENLEVLARGSEVNPPSETCPPSSSTILNYDGYHYVGKSVKHQFNLGQCFEKSPLSLIPNFNLGYCPVNSEYHNICPAYPNDTYFGNNANSRDLFNHYYATHGGVLTLKHPNGKIYEYYFNQRAYLVSVF